MNPSLPDAQAYAEKYLGDLLSFYGLNTTIESGSSDGEVIELKIPSSHLNAFLIGQRGETLRAMQFLTASSLKSKNYQYSRVNVDVGGYKQQRADRITETAGEWITEVKSSGKPLDLEPMNAADRRIVHQAVATAGLQTESVGEGRERHIVIKPV